MHLTNGCGKMTCSMTLVIPLSEEVEQRLKREATRRGMDPARYAQELLEEHLPAAETGMMPDDASLNVLESWEAENPISGADDLARRQHEGEEFMKQLARNRRETEGPNARDLWP